MPILDRQSYDGDNAAISYQDPDNGHREDWFRLGDGDHGDGWLILTAGLDDSALNINGIQLNVMEWDGANATATADNYAILQGIALLCEQNYVCVHDDDPNRERELISIIERLSDPNTGTMLDQLMMLVYSLQPGQAATVKVGYDIRHRSVSIEAKAVAVADLSDPEKAEGCVIRPGTLPKNPAECRDSLRDTIRELMGRAAGRINLSSLMS